jgi:hypothetical protein
VHLDLVTIHVDQADKILVRRRAVITLKEIVDHHLPVAGDVIVVALREGDFVDPRTELANLLLQARRLLFQRRCVEIEINKHQSAENLDLHRLQRKPCRYCAPP